MKKIFIKLFFAAAPLILLMLFYVIQDPFKVVWHYNKFYEKEGIVNVVLNNEYISTENFLNNYKNYHYDSYIFGNSRSRNYEIEYWKTKINTRYAYHFDASNENLYGIERKLAFLSNRNLPIKNALLVIDDEVLSSIENPKGHVFRKHPAISGESWFSFEMLNFQDFVNFDFITQYCHFLIYKIPENSEKAKLMIVNAPYTYNYVTNEETHTIVNAAIERNTDSFYNYKKDIFYKRTDTQRVSPIIIDSSKLNYLIAIKKVFDKNNTNYKIVLNPLYKQLKINDTDLQTLKTIFGSNNVYDFSGINEITNNCRNYYEASHYRPHVAKYIMDSIYKKM